MNQLSIYRTLHGPYLHVLGASLVNSIGALDSTGSSGRMAAQCYLF